LNAGQFVVIVGIDGAGKSTVVDNLASNTCVVTWQEVLEIDALAHAYGDPKLAQKFPQIREQLRPRTRAFEFLMFFAAMYEYLIQPRLADGRDVIVDSYYYKQLAKESVLGKAHPSLYVGARTLPSPDHVFLLDVAPEVAYARKGGLPTTSEVLGSHDLRGFERMQSALAKELTNLTEDLETSTVDSSRQTPEELACHIQAFLTKHAAVLD